MPVPFETLIPYGIMVAVRATHAYPDADTSIIPADAKTSPDVWHYRHRLARHQIRPEWWKETSLGAGSMGQS